MRDDTKIIPPIFVSETTITVIKNLHISWIHNLQSWDYFSTKTPSLSKQFFLLCMRCHMLITENCLLKHQKPPCTLCFSSFCLTNGILGVHPSGSHKDGDRRC